MLSQSLYWSRVLIEQNKSNNREDRDGWFWKTRADWLREIALSKHEQDTARKRLRALPFWQERRKGLPAKMHFRVDADELARQIDHDFQGHWDWQDRRQALQLLGRPVLVFRQLADLCQSVTAAILLSQLLGEERSALRISQRQDNWHSYQFPQLMSVTGLTRDELIHARKILREQGYGTELPHPKHPTAHGLVSHFGALYALCVELVLSDVDQDGHRWVRFPREVLPAEEPLNWLASPPPIATLKPNRLEALVSTSRHVANRLRCINNDLNTATHQSDAPRRMATSVIRHLDKAAVDATSSSFDAHALVPWELQMACEKTMKVYLSQIKLEYPETHDLRALNKLAEPTLNWPEVRKSLAAFPTDVRVIKWRYGELNPPTAAEVWRMYGAAVELIHGYAGRMTRKFTFNNFAVKLKKAPWD